MAVHLRVHFTGLCLFVPDRTTGELHVVLPATPAVVSSTDDHHGHVEEHIVRLAYDQCHLAPGATDYSGRLVQHDLHASALEVGALPPGGAPPAMPEGMYHLSRVVGQRRVRRKDVGLEPNPYVAARVTLAGQRSIYCAPAKRWDMPGHDTQVLMTWRVGRAVDIAGGDALRDLWLRGLNEQPDTALPPLYPTNGAVDILAYNVPRDDAPPRRRGRPGTDEQQAEHFRAYYPLVGGAAGKPTPKNPSTYSEEVPGCPAEVPGPWTIETNELYGDFFTCMVAQASLEG